MKNDVTDQTQRGYFPWTSEASLTSEVLKFFDDNGYVILTGFATPEEIDSMRISADQIIADFRDNPPSEVSVFTSDNQDKKIRTRYFLNSSDRVSCFLEEKDLTKVNKIGHALHELVPSFKRFSFAPRISAIASSFGVEQACLVQSMYILKNAEIGGEVLPHRDATFVRGPDGRCLGYWWALEDATLSNGCLWAVPGSHRDISSRLFTLDETKENTKFIGVDTNEYGMDDYVAVPMSRGDLILLHGNIVHMSKENTSSKSRHAYSIHVVSQDIGKDCWLQRPNDMPFKFIDDKAETNQAQRRTNVDVPIH